MPDRATLIIRNLAAALTVSFVALSLGAAFGIMSKRGAFAGMIAAAIIPIVTSALGGTRVQTSGPTAPMTAITALLASYCYETFAQTMPDYSADHFISIVLLLTSFFLMLAAAVRLGKLITYVPQVVISGFMNGIAVLIWVQQLQLLLGLDGQEPLSGSLVINVVVASASIVVILVAPAVLRRYAKPVASILSGTLVAIVALTTVATVCALQIEHVALERVEGLGTFVHLFERFVPTSVSWEIIVLATPWALQLAVLAYLDSLLTALVVDKRTGETTQPNKELFAQGLSQAAVMPFGGIPGAQATIRSILIINEGACYRWAGVLVGVFALIEMILLQDVITLIPKAVFVGVLIKVGWDVFDWHPVRIVWGQFTAALAARTQTSSMAHALWALLGRPTAELYAAAATTPSGRIHVGPAEIAIIAGTTIVTVLVNLNVAVGAFTVLFYVVRPCLKRLAGGRFALHDLKPQTPPAD